MSAPERSGSALSPSLPSFENYLVCGIGIAAITPQAAGELIARRAVAGGAFQVHLCNAYTLSLVNSDPRLRSGLEQADLNLPDGAPVAWLGRRLGTAGPVRGPALVGDVARSGSEYGLRHYLYGGAPGTAEAMAGRLRRHAPGVRVVGWESPPYREVTDSDLDAVAQRVQAVNAQVVWVGLGTPRQDYVVPLLARRAGVTVVPVGAAFDFWAGSVRQAPRFLHGTGLEWVYRLGVEPRRLWRRYLFGNPRFVVNALRQRR